MYARNNFSAVRGKLPSDTEITSAEPPVASPQRPPNGGRRTVHISRPNQRDTIPPPDYGGTVIFEKMNDTTASQKPPETRFTAAPQVKRKVSPQPDREYEKAEPASAEVISPPNFDSDDILLAALVILLMMGGMENEGKIDEQLLLIFALLLFAA